MQRTPSSFLASILVGLLLLQGLTPLIYSQEAPAQQQNVPPPTAAELDQLLSPIALYPDALLAQITTACTNPQEILDVTNWLAKNPNLKDQALIDAAQKEGFDPAFLALVTFPTVLQMMADNIDDYAAIGQAVTADQATVADSIQRLRTKAYASGALRTSEQQKVEVQQEAGQTIYVIQPANPQIVYIPQYNPTVVYVVQPTPPATPFVTFAVGIGIGILISNNQPWGWGGWGWGWHGHRGVYYNRGPWGGVWVGGYRPPTIWYHPRPPYYAHYPGYGGNWGYRPPHYHPPYPSRPPAYRPPSHYPGNPGYRPPVNNGKPIPKPYAPSTRPATNGNKPVTPSTGKQPTTPTTRPGGSSQGGTRPTQPSNPAPKPQTQNKPAPKPMQPSNPAPKPQTQYKPAPKPTQPSNPAPKPQTQNKPAPKPQPQNRPAPKPKPQTQNKPAPKPPQTSNR